MNERSERLETVAEAIESVSFENPIEGVQKFDISVWAGGARDESHYCGTACCIAGMAVFIFGSEEDKKTLKDMAELHTKRIPYAHWPQDVMALDRRMPRLGRELLRLYHEEEHIFYAASALNRPEAAAEFLRHMKNHEYPDGGVYSALEFFEETGELPE